jgi:hypothetical protein
MVVALHHAIFLGEQNAGDAVARLGVTADEAVGIAIGAAASVGRHGGAFGVADTRVAVEAGFL